MNTPSPAEGLPQEDQKEQRRWQILIAGLKVFARKGYAGTAMKDVAEAAGVSYGLAYHYFASKDALFGSLVEIALEESIKLYAQAVALDSGPEGKIRRIVEGMLATMDDEISPLFFLIMIQASTLAGMPETVRSLFLRRMGEYEALIMPVIEEGQRRSLIRPGPAAAHANYLGAVFHGLAFTRSVNPQAPLPDAEGILRAILV